MATVYRTEQFQLHSSTIDQTFHIDVALPDGYYQDTTKRYPVAYVLDGNLAFHLAAMTNSLCARDMLDHGVEAAIVIGIGYPNPAELSVRRVRDYTPRDSVDDWFADLYIAVAGERAATGGAQAFLDFLQGDLHRSIASRYRLRDDTAALFGDSYGGLFTYYAMLQSDSLYDRFWIGSPGIFGRGAYLLDKLVPRLDAGFARPTRIALTLGAGERSLSVGGALREEIYQEIARSYDAIVETLGRRPVANLAFAAQEFEGESHVSVMAPGFTFAWRYLMRRSEGSPS